MGMDEHSWAVSRYNPASKALTMPDCCHGCAWAGNYGQCAVFTDPWTGWRDEAGNCEAHATEEQRDAIESAIRAYERAYESR